MSDRYKKPGKAKRPKITKKYTSKRTFMAVSSGAKNIKTSYSKVTEKPVNFLTNMFLKFPLLPKDRTKRLQVLTYLFSFVLFGMVAIIFAIIIITAIFARQLPDPNTLLERTNELSTRFYDRNDKLIYEVYGDKNRTLVQVENISPNVIHATLATEDSEFYLHKGYSFRGMARAIYNTFTGAGLQGGSTLTQQSIKNTLLTQERTFTRKIKEGILSLQLESRYSKEQILQIYLNETPYGGMNYGIYSAAKAYFNKEPQNLTLAEAAYIAGLPQSPTAYSQFGPTPEKGIARKNYVLYLMNVRGWIGPDGKRYYLSDEDYERIKEEELDFEFSKVPLEAPHFVFYAKQYLVDILGEDVVERGGLRIKTTLDLDVQNLAQEAVDENIIGNEVSLNLWNASVVVLDPKDGGILAMVGSKGYNIDPQPEGCVSGTSGENSCKFDPYVNIAISNRQPGSAIKPITYATMLSKGYTAATPILDVPTKFQGSEPSKPYTPVNYDGIFRGPMPLRKSLGNSLNIPAVKALKVVGLDSMIDMAENMGISTFTDRTRYGLALTLGGGETKLLELTGAFNVFATKGYYRPPTPIIEVKDSQDRIVYTPIIKEKKVIDDGVAFLISDILSDDGARSAAFGAGSLLNIPGYQVAVKTGTTDDKRDNYAMGYTPSIVVGVWVGNSNNEKMNPYVASGISGATPVWNYFMKNYLEGKESEKFNPPSNVEKIEIDELTGGLPYSNNKTRQEWFIKGTEPTARSDWYKRLEVCKYDGRVANDECRDAGETKTIDFVHIKALLPEWQPSVDAWIKEFYSADTRYYPAQMTSCLRFEDGEVSNKDEVCVDVTGLKNGDRVPLDFRLNVEVSSYHGIDRVTFYVNDEKIAEDKSDPYGYNFSFDSGKIGEHEFKIVVRDEKGNKGEKSLKLNVSGY